MNYVYYAHPYMGITIYIIYIKKTVEYHRVTLVLIQRYTYCGCNLPIVIDIGIPALCGGLFPFDPRDLITAPRAPVHVFINH